MVTTPSLVRIFIFMALIISFLINSPICSIFLSIYTLVYTLILLIFKYSNATQYIRITALLCPIINSSLSRSIFSRFKKLNSEKKSMLHQIEYLFLWLILYKDFLLFYKL